jgi:dolichyl-diphosphooligosaccharide--protein glycosyltransferase/undecaprenyl-diphosphooligosaccharide--protein glycosyltransferase
MTGYYDTDMFSVLLQFSIFYSFLSIVYKKNIASIVMAAFFIIIYPYFYSQGVSIVYVVFMFMLGYLLLEYLGIFKMTETQSFKGKENIFFFTVILLSIMLMTTLPIEYRVVLFVVTLILLLNVKLEKQYLLYVAIAVFLGFLFFGNIFQIIIGKIFSYIDRSVEAEGLHFYQVIQTVREAGSIPMTTVANRISGSSIGLFLALIGYTVLVMRHRPFIIALPLIGVGLFAYIGGLRFTVYAVPVAAISVVYLFYVLGDFFKDKKFKYLFTVSATAAMIYPNITHIIGYKVPTVLNKTEVGDLKKLKQISTADDYTLTWWDYGYPIWFYSDTNTLIDGGKHTNDNYIVSKILQTTSSELAARLSRLAVETYVDSNYSIVANTLFKNKEEDQLDPTVFLDELENDVYEVPKKTRDVYLYLPFRMLNIFPTVMVFGNLDLNTGKALRKVHFYPTNAVSNKNGMIAFNNGIVFNAKKGEILLRRKQEKVQNFIVTQNVNNGKILVQSQRYHADGRYVVIYMKSYGKFIVMDTETFKSTYIQMFVLGKYDKDLFELVISSPYSRIYKLKK